MTAIDIGPGATDGETYFGSMPRTIISAGNPANADGILDTVEIWAYSALSNVKVGTFYYVSGSYVYACRDSAVIGSVTAGSKQTFSGLSIQVHTGDLLGLYATSGNIESNIAPGIYSVSADGFANNQTYTWNQYYNISLYGSGVTVMIGGGAIMY